MAVEGKKREPGQEEHGLAKLVSLELGLPLEPGADARKEDSPQWIKHPPRDVFGLALSGGGIRSATFNLGLLQGLHRLKLLKVFDYLSTVSGGGYIGGFWTAARYREEKSRQPEENPRTAPSPAGSQNAEPYFPSRKAEGADEPDELRHLREFSNFLAPRLGLLSFDTGRIVVALLSAIIPSLLATFALLTILLLGWETLALLTLREQQGQSRVPGGPGVVMMGLTFLALLLTQRGWRKKEAEVRAVHYIPAMLLALLATAAVWTLDVQPGSDIGPLRSWLDWKEPPGDAEKPSSRHWLAMLAPAATWAMAAGSIILVRNFLSWMGTVTSQRAWSMAVDLVNSRLLLLAAVWTAMAVCWFIGVTIFDAPNRDNLEGRLAALTAFATALSAAFAMVQKFLSRQPSIPSLPGRRGRLKPWTPKLLAYVVLGLFIIGVVVLGALARDGGWLVWLAVGAGAATLGTLFLVDTTRVGLHGFYRSRLARAYLGASNPIPPGRTAEHPADDIRLSELQRLGPPCHLICCAANDLRPKNPLENLYRGAQSAVISPEGMSVAAEAAAWWKKTDRGSRPGRAPTLAAAMTASGAAFNSHMGFKSQELGPAVTFLMTAFNLRLGLWWPHPTRAAAQKSLFWRLFWRLVGWMKGLTFYKELFGLSRAQGNDVLLSDGGHFENLALYELVRRHCRYILLSDCGMDPNVAFDDFGNAVRRVREDFDVEIRIDLSPLHPSPDTGLARQPMVAGDIHYPTGDTGVLLIIKPTLVGNEPADITQYKSRNSAFPHESTGDQFYDEAQWESYRKLGMHATEAAFAPVLKQLKAAPECGWNARLFARARREWLPLPPDYAERYGHFASRAAELDTLLQGREYQRVLREVFKELDELDRQPSPGAKPGAVPAAARDTAADSAIQGLSRQDLPLPLHLIRRALLLMEEVFLRENLEERYSHPAFLGLINYFARWAYAPLFRMWWPLLKTLYSQRFTRFIEERFGLTTRERQPQGMLVLDSEGYAMRCWLQQEPRVKPEGTTLISYQLELSYRGLTPNDLPSPFPIQAAQVFAYELRRSNGQRMLAWHSHDFFVPPGLWGVGIGEAFLMQLARRDVLSRTLGGEVAFLAVGIDKADTRLGLDSKQKEWADEAALYRSCGFTDHRPGQTSTIQHRMDLDELERKLRLQDAGGHARSPTQWLVRAPEDHPRTDQPSYEQRVTLQ